MRQKWWRSIDCIAVVAHVMASRPHYFRYYLSPLRHSYKQRFLSSKTMISLHPANNSVQNLNGAPRPSDEVIRKKPLSAYQLWFQYQRKRILEGNENQMPSPLTPLEARQLSWAIKSQTFVRPQLKKKVSFQELARMIAKSWKALDPQSRRVLEVQAALDRQEYNQDMHFLDQQEAQGGYRHLLSSASSLLQNQSGNQDVLTRLQQLVQIRELLETEMNRQIVEHATKVDIDCDQRNRAMSLFEPLPLDSTDDSELVLQPIAFWKDKFCADASSNPIPNGDLIDPSELDSLFD